MHPRTPALLVGLVSCVTGSCLLTGAWIQDMKRDQKASRADLFTPARTLCHRRASIIQKHIVRDSLQPRCENIGRLPRWFDLSHAISRDPPAGCQEHCSSHVCKFRSSTLIAGQLRLCPLRLKGASQAPTGCILKWYIYSKDTSTFSPNKRREHRTKQVNPFNPFIMQVKHFVGIFIISVGLGQGLALPSNHSSLLIKRRACAIEEIQNRDPGVNPISCTFDCGIGKFALPDQVCIHSDPILCHGTQRDRAGKCQRESSYRPVLITSIFPVL